MIIKKRDVLQHFYNNVYSKYLYSGGAQQRGTAWASKLLEKQFSVSQVDYTLEIGGGSGEHLRFVRTAPHLSYYSLDIRKPEIEISKVDGSDKLKKVLSFVVGDAESIPFEDLTMDRVSGTCVFYHLNDPFQALQEIRRVAKNEAEIVFVLPTDPGILNRFVKKTITFRKLRKLSDYPPELFYALDHQNHIGSLIQMFEFVFRNDKIEIKYFPLRFKSWNFNMLVTLKAIKKEYV